MKIIWTNGCFDVLHVGHIRMLRFAKNLGDMLIVGIDSDERVKQLKGSTRPINTAADREEMLRSLKYVDDVVVFDSEEDLTSLLARIKPEMMVVGSDYENQRVIGAEHAGQIMYVNRIEPYSTTRILQLGSKK